jgi:hypothetical protein
MSGSFQAGLLSSKERANFGPRIDITGEPQVRSRKIHRSMQIVALDCG